MHILPCSHPAALTDQIEPTKHMLLHLDEEHPDVLKQHGVNPKDYHSGFVFRSAIESIRGTLAATTSPRSEFTIAILERMKNAGLVTEWQSIGGKGRCDYSVKLRSGKRDVLVGVESKGGEGNSFNIGDRPLWASEYVIWGHLDGAIVNPPAHGAASNLFTRLSSEIVANQKLVSAYIVLDRFCNTRIRPCPKMPAGTLNTVPPPCVFLLPRTVPNVKEPKPGMARITDVLFVNRLLDLFGVKPGGLNRHVMRVGIEVYRKPVSGKKGRYADRAYRRITVLKGDECIANKEIPITRGDILQDVPQMRDGSSSLF